MIRLFFITSAQERIEVEGRDGQSVMQAATQHGVPGIDAVCSGSMVCGTCHVLIDERWRDKLPRPSDVECEILQYVPNPSPNARLTCQLRIGPELDGIELFIPESQS